MDQQLWQVIFPFLYGKQKGPFNKITLFLPFTSLSVEEPYQSTVKDVSFPFLTPPLLVSLHCRALSSAFSQHGVPFWTSGGTTLGIVRYILTQTTLGTVR